VRVLVAGAAGLIGSHLVDALLGRGDEVVAVDNFVTGRPDNLTRASADPRCSVMVADICEPLPPTGPIDAVCHLASPDSPRDVDRLGLEILHIGSEGTLRLLELASLHHARFLLASTSEVYGEPEEHPQREDYRGNVSTTGPRACFDEARRFAEAAASTFERQFEVEMRIAQIFNTYGPRMRPDDGRVVSNLIVEALKGEPLTVHGDGSQTRSLCYVDDQVRGLLALLDSDVRGPVNIGSDEETTIAELAQLIARIVGVAPTVDRRPIPTDYTTRRRPSLDRAHRLLGWSPIVPLKTGLARTVDWFRAELSASESAPAHVGHKGSTPDRLAEDRIA